MGSLASQTDLFTPNPVPKPIKSIAVRQQNAKFSANLRVECCINILLRNLLKKYVYQNALYSNQIHCNIGSKFLHKNIGGD